jgi:ATP-dependent HslUV protease ATP-binding subunit HslU
VCGADPANESASLAPLVGEVERSDRRRLNAQAADVNRRTNDIGARRLHTVLERLLDDLLYNAPDIGTQTIPITPAYVRERLGALVADEDLARYIL